MASESSIRKWIKALSEVEAWNDTPSMRLTRAAIEKGAPASKAPNMFQVVTGALTMPFRAVWDAAPPTEPELLEILQPVADAIGSLDSTQGLLPQIDHLLAIISHAKDQLDAQASLPLTVDEIINDIERALKISLLVAGTSHIGPMMLIDKEIGDQTAAINHGTNRVPKYFDLATLGLVDTPSETTVSLAELRATVDRGPARTWDEVLRPDPTDQPLIMKQFAAQAIVDFYTEWEEYYRPALAKALGCAEDDIRVNYFGDIRNMRQDYVHCRGYCRNSAKNKTLKWFSKGQAMIPTHANYLELLTAFPSDQLRIKPLPFIKDRRRVEANAKSELIDRFDEVVAASGISKDAALDEALRAWMAERGAAH